MRTKLAAVLIVLVAAGCGSDGDSAVDPTTTSTAAPPTTVLAPEGFPVTDVAELEQARLELVSPDWLVADDTGVWVKRDNGFVDAIDPATNEVVHTVDIRAADEVAGAGCAGLGAGFGSIWTCTGTDLVRIDPETGEITATIPVGKARAQGRLATAFDRVWVLTGDGSTLVGIDPETQAPAVTVVLGTRGTDVGAGEAGLWVVSKVDNEVLRVDPVAGEVQVRVTDVVAPSSVSVTDVVWVGSGQRTVRLDPASGAVAASSDIAPGSGGTVATDGEGGVWVRSADRFLVHLDGDAQPVEGLASPDTPSGGDVVVAFDSLWVTAYDDGTLFRLSPAG